MTGLFARYATTDERERWDDLVAANPAGGDFVSTLSYAETKATVGWTPKFLVFTAAETPATIVSVALVLERTVATVGTYWYLPHGPSANTPAALREHAEALASFVREKEPRVFAVTVEPLLENTPAHHAEIDSWSASGATLDMRWRPGIQGNTNTAIVNIHRDDDALKQSFHKKCRNMISRALRDGVEIIDYPASPETFAHMHRLMRLVQGGKAVLRLRSEEYTEQLWRGFSARGQGRFFAIEVDGTPAVMAYMIRVGDRAFYKDGGSERPRVSPGMSNLLQWHMMQTAREEGAVSFDLVGVPAKENLDNPNDPNFSLAPFKLSFAREVTEYIGAYDIVLKPAAFKRWQKYGLPIAQRLHRRKYNDLAMY